MSRGYTLISKKAILRIARIARATGKHPVLVRGISSELETNEQVIPVQMVCLPHYTKPIWAFIAFRDEPMFDEWSYLFIRQVKAVKL